MFLGCHFVYDLSEAEIVVKDMLAANATYYYGQALKSSGGVVSTAGAGTGLLTGVCNEGGINNTGKTLAGTVAAGTSETLKLIVNPNAVYRIQYDDSSKITWTAVTDTTIEFTGAWGTSLAGGWAWSYNTGKLDWIVSSADDTPAPGTSRLTTVTGTDTTSTTGILIQPQGKTVVTLNAAATKINGALTTKGTAKTNGFNAFVLGNVIVSSTMAVEKLNPASNAVVDGAFNVVGASTPSPTVRMNQKVRYMISQTTAGKTNDKARAFADVCFMAANEFVQVS